MSKNTQTQEQIDSVVAHALGIFGTELRTAESGQAAGACLVAAVRILSAGAPAYMVLRAIKAQISEIVLSEGVRAERLDAAGDVQATPSEES